MKYYVTKHKWFQRTNQYIPHIQTTNDEYNSGNDDASVASDTDVSIASAISGRSAAKSGYSGLQICHTQLKQKLLKIHMVIGGELIKNYLVRW